jgi:hypothetical protein
MFLFYNKMWPEHVRFAQPVWQIEVRKTSCAAQKVDKSASKANLHPPGPPEHLVNRWIVYLIQLVGFRPAVEGTHESRASPVLLDFFEHLPKVLQRDNGFFVCMGLRGLLLSNWQRTEPSF